MPVLQKEEELSWDYTADGIPSQPLPRACRFSFQFHFYRRVPDSSLVMAGGFRID